MIYYAKNNSDKTDLEQIILLNPSENEIIDNLDNYCRFIINDGNLLIWNGYDFTHYDVNFAYLVSSSQESFAKIIDNYEKYYDLIQELDSAVIRGWIQQNEHKLCLSTCYEYLSNDMLNFIKNELFKALKKFNIFSSYTLYTSNVHGLKNLDNDSELNIIEENK